MKVIYDDPDGRKGTYHPVLGYLESGVPFDLPDEVAKRYVKSGLLKKIVIRSPVPVTRKKRKTEPGSREPSFHKEEVKDGYTDNGA